MLNADADKWPIKLGRIGGLLFDAFALLMNEGIDELRARGKSLRDIALLFGRPTRLWHFAHHYLNGMRRNRCSLREQRRRILDLLDMIAYLKVGGEFPVHGRNLTMLPDDVAQLLGCSFTRAAAPEHRKAVQQLCGTLWAYVEATCFATREISMEMHGPYDVPDLKDHVLVVRDYFDLGPRQLWPELPAPPFRELRIAALYQGVSVTFDVYNNLYIQSGDLKSGLQAYYVTTAGGPLDVERLDSLSEQLTSAIIRISENVDSWPVNQIGMKYAEILWYRNKPLSDALGRGWRPDPVLLRRFDHVEVPVGSERRPGREEVLRTLDLVDTSE